MAELIQSQVQTSSEEFQQNREHHAALSQEVQEAVERVREGGSKDAVDRHHSRGKLLPRERIDRILDPGSPFLELSPLAAKGLYDDVAPGAGIVTGIGKVEGREVMIIANDATVKGGIELRHAHRVAVSGNTIYGSDELSFLAVDCSGIAVGANSILNFRYGQRSHKWYQQIALKWDQGEWYGEGSAVCLELEG